MTAFLQKATIPIEWSGLHNLVIRVPPIVPSETPYPAVFNWDILNAAGTVVLFAAIIAGFEWARALLPN